MELLVSIRVSMLRHEVSMLRAGMKFWILHKLNKEFPCWEQTWKVHASLTWNFHVKNKLNMEIRQPVFKNIILVTTLLQTSTQFAPLPERPSHSKCASRHPPTPDHGGSGAPPPPDPLPY